MKKLFLAGASAAALAFSSPALAADLPVFQEPVLTPVAPIFDFSGFYIGANVGYINGDLSAEDSTTGITFTQPSGGFFDDDGDDDGFIGGVQAGFNAQFDQFVLGIEGDIQAVSFGDDDDGGLFNADAFGLAVLNTPVGTAAVDVDVDYLATLRGRAGVAFDRFMIYGTGGVAFTSLDTELRNPFSGTQSTAVFNQTGDDGDVEVGYAVGGGVEGLITQNLTAKLEYLYVDFEETDLDFQFTPAGGALTTRNTEVEFDAHIIRAGINYKFGGLGGF